MPSDQKSVALFLDAENLFLAAKKAKGSLKVSELVSFAKSHGAIIFARAYADWSRPGLSSLVHAMQQCGLQMEQLTTDGTGKNTADVQLALDAFELICSSDPPTVVVLATGDRDLVPLVYKLRRRSVYTVGVGFQTSTSKTLKAVCDRYVYYEALAASQAKHENEREVSSRNPCFDLLMRAVRQAKSDKGTADGSYVLHVMKQLQPDFSLRASGYKTLKKLVLAAEKLHLVTASSNQTGPFVIDILSGDSQ